MTIKGLGVFVLVSGLASTGLYADCRVRSVEADTDKQVEHLVRMYDSAKTPDDKSCLAIAMRDLLEKLKKQSLIYHEATIDEDMGGESAASDVNRNEAVALDKSIKKLEAKIATIAQVAPAKKTAVNSQAKKEETSRKRRRSTN